MLQHILQDKRPDVQTNGRDQKAFDQPLEYTLPPHDTVLNDASRDLLKTLCEALVEYHNAPILIYEPRKEENRKRVLMRANPRITEMLDTSKIRWNHIQGIRLLINVLQSMLPDLQKPSAHYLSSCLGVFDSKFFHKGKNPDAYGKWDRADQIDLAQTINPHIRELFREITQILSSPVEAPPLIDVFPATIRQ